ncbi:uncharacterized protein BCR38DRAFT_473373 [Pseudomassariella vexata]|uniref:Uncharacterized protein n=1 Tax=Pseudomassariella vexata TaxID=1141098 RepID=A0A1Y2E3D4_9PEZI|nr:uncharacterized protein BCR38DRAFT_473373 [Pseudomassariella vexata]ORY66042.1 hypothetical protein BCR38DRAFT_473373 [Pseudomassariella vexata]
MGSLLARSTSRFQQQRRRRRRTFLDLPSPALATVQKQVLYISSLTPALSQEAAFTDTTQFSLRRVPINFERRGATAQASCPSLLTMFSGIDASPSRPIAISNSYTGVMVTQNSENRAHYMLQLQEVVSLVHEHQPTGSRDPGQPYQACQPLQPPRACNPGRRLAPRRLCGSRRNPKHKKSI